jgi:branched-chain amino acid aminotransferase
MTYTPISAPSPEEGIDFSALPWNLNLPERHSYVHITTTTNEWSDDEHYDNLELAIVAYQDTPLDIRPAMTSLNYGTTVWEGLKCYRLDDGSAAVFRADRNYERMKRGADELCLPMPSRRLFLRAIQLVIQANAALIPPSGNGMKLYVRPMLLGSGQQLGLYPSPEFSFIVYVSPTGNYFKSTTSGLNLHLETKRARAARGGLGSTKCSGNYAVALKPLMDCKKQGFVDNVFLELETYKPGQLSKAVVQEMSAANVFLVLASGEIVTPSLSRGTILPGVTRESVLELISAYHDELLKVMLRSRTGLELSPPPSNCFGNSRDVTVGEFMEATEAFCTGTAAEIVPIARLATGEGEEAFERVFPHGADLPGGPVTSKLLEMLRQAMAGKHVLNGADSNGSWIRNPFSPEDDFCEY